MPAQCNAVFAVLMAGKRGNAAVVYFASSRIGGSPLLPDHQVMKEVPVWTLPVPPPTPFDGIGSNEIGIVRPRIGPLRPDISYPDITIYVVERDGRVDPKDYNWMLLVLRAKAMFEFEASAGGLLPIARKQ
jgi:hypothetical protein